MTLWDEVKDHLERFEPGSLDDNASDLQGFENLLNELDNLDSGSFTFRYPEARDGTPSYRDRWSPNTKISGPPTFPPLVGIANLRYQLRGMFLFLSGVYDWAEDRSHCRGSSQLP